MPVPKDVGDRTAYQLQTEQKSDLLRFSGKTELSMTPDLLLLVAHMHLMPSTGEGSQHTQVLHDRVSESHWQVCRVELSQGGFSPVLPTTAPSPEKYFPSAASRAENRAEAQPGQTRGMLRTSSEFGFESHELRIQILHTAQQPKRLMDWLAYQTEHPGRPLLRRLLASICILKGRRRGLAVRDGDSCGGFLALSRGIIFNPNYFAL